MKIFEIEFSDGGDSSVGITPINVSMTFQESFIQGLKNDKLYDGFRKDMENLLTKYGQDFHFSSQDEEENFLEPYYEMVSEDTESLKQEIEFLKDHMKADIENDVSYSLFLRYGQKAIDILKGYMEE